MATVWSAAHPRSRGENNLFLRRHERDVGSSPLTRGKRWPEAAQCTDEGLIPAHAGKTATLSGDPYPRRAHPRSRGENTS